MGKITVIPHRDGSYMLSEGGLSFPTSEEAHRVADAWNNAIVALERAGYGPADRALYERLCAMMDVAPWDDARCNAPQVR